MDVKVIVATHRECEINPDPLYLPIHAGAAVHSQTLPYTGDDTGDNISRKNPNYCELTALYWAWKNLDADCLGLCHYRRYFGFGKQILTRAQAEALLEKWDILVPKPRNYVIETNYSQYVHAHNEIDLTETRRILAEQDAANGTEYAAVFDRVMKRTVGHRFNMFIMRRTLADEYCTWLFGVLFELEKRLDISEYSANDARVFGFVGERLFDVWLETNGKPYKELPYIFIGRENWPVKILNFLKRKFRKK